MRFDQSEISRFYAQKRFLRPHDKPPFGSRINWQHPYSNGLKACFLMNEFAGSPYDLLGETHWKSNNSKPFWKGEGIYFDGSDDRMQYDSEIIRSLGACTVITIWSTLRNAASDGIWGIYAGAGPGRWGGFWTGNGTLGANFFRYDSGNSYQEVEIADSNVDDGVPNFSAGRCFQGADLDLHHGKLGNLLTYAAGGHSESWKVNPSSDDLAFGTYNAGGGNEFQGIIIALYVYDYAIPTYQIYGLNQNPYQFIQPPLISRQFNVPVAAGVTVTFTKTALAFTGKALLPEEEHILTKEALTLTGKDVGTIHTFAFVKTALTLTGKALLPEEQFILVKKALALTGKALSTNVTFLLVKKALVLTGKAMTATTGEILTLTKTALVLTGKALHANEIYILTKTALTLTGKAVSTAIDVIFTFTKTALTLTGKALFMAEIFNFITGTLLFGGKALGAAVAGAVVRAGKMVFGTGTTMD